MALLVGVFFAVAIYLFLSKHIIRILLGAAILSNAVNLLIFTSGRLTREVPPILSKDAPVSDVMITANPLPQALILTAIVIGFGLLAFALTLAFRAWKTLGTVTMDAMRACEPRRKNEPEPEPEDAL